MQVSIPSSKWRPAGGQSAGYGLLLLLAILLGAPAVGVMAGAWRSDSSLSHGPLVPLLTAWLVWERRAQLRRWNAAALPGLLLMACCALLHVASVWADVEYLKPLSLLGTGVGAVWFLGGKENVKAALGALAFLVFMIPWPTTLVERLTFPLQLTSSAYAALFGGLLGLPIHREGVELAVTPNPSAPPIYSILVAQKCSGLTSLMVLLALGYLIAYFTPVRLGWRALLVGCVAPLTLLANAVRLTVILLAGTHGNPALARWVHDHEGPVLIFLCSIALMALRQALLVWTRPREYGSRPEDAAPAPARRMEGDAVVQIPASHR